MPLWTDLITPAELTGYARESLAAYEARKGTLARWLPNREVLDIVVRFVQGQSGLVPIAQFRAFDAEPGVGKGPQGKRVTLELPALGQNIPVSEYQQLRARNADDDSILREILNTTDRVVIAVSDAIERLRGIVIATGKATINSTNFGGPADGFWSDDDFGRAAGHTVSAGSAWSTGSVSRLTDLQTWFDVYVGSNGVEPGAMLMSTRVLRALAAGTEFQTQLVNGGARPATRQQVEDVLAGAGLPPIYVYDRRVSVGGTATKVLPDDRLFYLPAPVETDGESELGATFWGETLTATEGGWGIESGETPGIVAGVYRGEKPPLIAEVISDAIALPVLANADLSFSADVL
jgi:hypothetical protein